MRRVKTKRERKRGDDIHETHIEEERWDDDQVVVDDGDGDQEDVEGDVGNYQP